MTMQTKYLCANFRGKERKSSLNAIIAVDVDSRIILYSQATKGPKHDTKLCNS